MKGRSSRTVRSRRPSPVRRKGKKPGTKSTSARVASNFHLISAKKFQSLEEKLREANETLEAIRTGAVDAVVVAGGEGNKIYSITGAEQPYRIYVERMQEGAVTVSADGVILYCNKRFAEMTQRPLERLIGSDLRLCFSPQTWDKVATIFQTEIEFIKHEDVMGLADGSFSPVNITASHLPVEGQEMACLVVTDLSSRKQQEELRFAKELAEKASQAKDEFLATLSHELRTPLNPALMTVVSLENNETVPDNIRESLAVIRRNIELEARMIDDLLDLTRVAQGKLELRPSSFDVHTVVALAVDICRSDIEAKRQSLDLRLKATHTKTTGDPVRLQQVIWNVIRNASKFTPQNGHIRITTSNHRENLISIAVTDTGIGFASGSADALFRAFEQGGHHITRRFGGLGLGLAISRSIMLLHGGAIRAASDGEGKGATFTVELPLRIPVKSGLAALPEPDRKQSTQAPGLRILLVEDHDDTRKSMEIILGIQRHQVQSASSGTAALALAEKGRFDLVITDLGLPDMSGYDLMKVLSEKHNLRGIATTGYGMKEDIEHSREAGFIEHLTKPIRLEQLQQLLARMSA